MTWLAFVKFLSVLTIFYTVSFECINVHLLSIFALENGIGEVEMSRLCATNFHHKFYFEEITNNDYFWDLNYRHIYNVIKKALNIRTTNALRVTKF